MTSFRQFHFKVQVETIAMFEFLAVSFLIGFVAANSEYCDAGLCSANLKHIACGNNGEFHKNCPADRKLVQLTDNDTNLILRTHNAYRNRIAGGTEVGFFPASRMATMVSS